MSKWSCSQYRSSFFAVPRASGQLLNPDKQFITDECVYRWLALRTANRDDLTTQAARLYVSLALPVANFRPGSCDMPDTLLDAALSAANRFSRRSGTLSVGQGDKKIELKVSLAIDYDRISLDTRSAGNTTLSLTGTARLDVLAGSVNQYGKVQTVKFKMRSADLHAPGPLVLEGETRERIRADARLTGKSDRSDSDAFSLVSWDKGAAVVVNLEQESLGQPFGMYLERHIELRGAQYCEGPNCGTSLDDILMRLAALPSAMFIAKTAWVIFDYDSTHAFAIYVDGEEIPYLERKWPVRPNVRHDVKVTLGGVVQWSGQLTIPPDGKQHCPPAS